ncbi:MAG: response regulator transcription factor [Oscillospiraceae bacterium]|nr:response regulator transcription factor [Oscillospiraceae bacterium]
MGKKTVLLVEDNVKLCEGNRRALESEGYEVYTALTLKQAREHLSRIEPDVILLDVVLPDGDGMDFCTEISNNTEAYVIFLTSRSEHAEMLRGLALGGDDYITKPFRLDELLHRVAAVVRRRGKETVLVQTIQKGSLTLDIIAGQAFINGMDLTLSQKEFAVLLYLTQNEGKTLSAENIYKKVWGQPMAGDKNAVQMSVSRLRKKIEPAGYDIFVTRGIGYFFGGRT